MKILKYFSACLALASFFSCQAELIHKDELLACSHQPSRINAILQEFSFGLAARKLAELDEINTFIEQIGYQGDRGALLFQSNVIGFFRVLTDSLSSTSSFHSLHEILSTIETLGDKLTTYINAFTGISLQCQSRESQDALRGITPGMFDIKRDLLKREKSELNMEKVRRLAEVTYKLSTLQQWLNGIRTPLQDLISNPKDSPESEIAAEAGKTLPVHSCKTLPLLKLGGYSVKE